MVADEAAKLLAKSEKAICFIGPYPLLTIIRQNEIALYTFMLLAPLNGYLFSNANAKDVTLFGTSLVLPPLMGADTLVAAWGHSAHVWLSYTLLALIFSHSLDQQK